MEHIFETFLSGFAHILTEWRDTCDLLYPELNKLKLPFYEYLATITEKGNSRSKSEIHVSLSHAKHILSW